MEIALAFVQCVPDWMHCEETSCFQGAFVAGCYGLYERILRLLLHSNRHYNARRVFNHAPEIGQQCVLIFNFVKHDTQSEFRWISA